MLYYCYYCKNVVESTYNNLTPILPYVFFATSICGALRDLVAFVQFEKREKLPWTSVNFSKVADFTLQIY